MSPKQRAIYEAWEKLHYALREAMDDMDPSVLRYLVERAEGNALVCDVAQDVLDLKCGDKQ